MVHAMVKLMTKKNSMASMTYSVLCQPLRWTHKPVAYLVLAHVFAQKKTFAPNTPDTFGVRMGRQRDKINHSEQVATNI